MKCDGCQYLSREQGGPYTGHARFQQNIFKNIRQVTITVCRLDTRRVFRSADRRGGTFAASRSKVQCIKEKLTTCKTLLHCKRDELKKLWLEAVEHKHVLQLLEEM